MPVGQKIHDMSEKLIYVVQFFLPFCPCSHPWLPRSCSFSGEIGGRCYMELNIMDNAIFQLVESDEDEENANNLMLLLRILVIFVHLPSEGLWDKIKKKNNDQDINQKYRQPFSNSYVLLLRHILNFTCLGKRKVRGDNLPRGIPVVYKTAERVMTVLSSYLSESSSRSTSRSSSNE